jgi:serine protease Do
MRRFLLPILAGSILVLGSAGRLWSVPNPDTEPEKKEKPKTDKADKAAAFKPIEINNELNQNDPNDPVRNNPAKQYAIKLSKDKSYVIDLVSADFDAFLRLVDNKGNQLADDDDGGGDLNARIMYTAKDSADHQIVVTSFDGQVGKFNLKVRELVLKGEPKPRAVGKNGLTINDNIGGGDVTSLGKIGKEFSVQLQAGKSYVIELESQTLDSYLYLFDGKNALLAQDDDSGGGVNSRIVFKAPRDGVYHLVATTLSGTDTGEFTLKVSKE